MVAESQENPEATELPFTGAGVAVNSSSDAVAFSGAATADAKATVLQWLEASGRGTGKVNYKLRDWLFSRQRYWGEPFPITFDEQGNPTLVEDLPVKLPVLDDYTPTASADGGRSRRVCSRRPSARHGCAPHGGPRPADDAAASARAGTSAHATVGRTQPGSARRAFGRSVGGG